MSEFARESRVHFPTAPEPPEVEGGASRTDEDARRIRATSTTVGGVQGSERHSHTLH